MGGEGDKERLEISRKSTLPILKQAFVPDDTPHEFLLRLAFCSDSKRVDDNRTGEFFFDKFQPQLKIEEIKEFCSINYWDMTVVPDDAVIFDK